MRAAVIYLSEIKEDYEENPTAYRRAGSILSFTVFPSQPRAEKPSLTLDEFFNSVEIRAVKLSPDGRAGVIATARAQWEENRFRRDLWLYREECGGKGSLVQLTRSGHDRSPEWSPDGRWFTFLSARRAPRTDGRSTDEREEKITTQLFVIAPDSGEAFQVTEGEEETHAFVWSTDSRLLYFAARTPWTKQQQEAYKKEWNDVFQNRQSERGDWSRSMEVASSIAGSFGGIARVDVVGETHTVATTPHRGAQLVASPDRRFLAFATESRSERLESLEPYGTYLVDLPRGKADLLSHARAIYEDLHWAADGSHIFLSVSTDSVEGKYQDVQPRIYWVDTARGSIERWGARFPGAIIGYAAAPSGALLGGGRVGTDVPVSFQRSPDAEFVKQPGWPGTYERLSTATHSPRVAFVFSSLQQPSEVYLAENADDLGRAR